MADSFASPRLAAVPTLDELAERPEAAAALPRAAVLIMHARAVRALVALEAPLLAGAVAAADEHRGDRLLGVEAAAERLGRSVDWLYRHARKLPFTVQEGRGARLRFSAEGIDRYLREHRGGLTPVGIEG